MKRHPLEASVRAAWEAGRSTTRIAADLGLSRSAVAGILYRARARGAAWAVPRPAGPARRGAERAGTLSDSTLLLLLAGRDRGIAPAKLARAAGLTAGEVREVLAAIDADLARSEVA